MSSRPNLETLRDLTKSLIAGNISPEEANVTWIDKIPHANCWRGNPSNKPTCANCQNCKNCNVKATK